VKLSELENAVLGVVWRRAPCSAYVIQKNFGLVSASWSASPGSVYPLVAKLCRLGLLSRDEGRRGSRSISEYHLTPEGLSQVRAWVQGLPEWAGRPPADAIRTRAFFLDTLESDDARLQFLKDAEAATKVALARLEDGIAGAGSQSELESLGQLGGALQLRARLEWLRRLREHFAKTSTK
jgi:DNA-binding PadR family transcriptional regulator